MTQGHLVMPNRPGGRPSSGEHPLAAAFTDLRDELIGTLAYLLQSREAALDAVQEAFLKCWRARDTLPAVRDVRAWIFRVGMNTARDLQRSAWSRRVKPLDGEELMLTARDDPPGGGLEDREDLDRLRRAIAGLRREEKEVFLLRQNGELTYEQIAEVLGIPSGTAKTRMQSALTKLRAVLGS